MTGSLSTSPTDTPPSQSPSSQSPSSQAPSPQATRTTSDIADHVESLLSPEATETIDAAGPDAAGPDAAATEAPAPVAYEPFVLPEGVEVDASALDEAQRLFAEARLSQPQAQKLVDLYAGKLGELVRRQIETQISAAEDRQKAWVAEVKSDPELGGARFAQARAAAQRALARFGTPELRRTLDELWVGNNPQLFRFFVRVGQAVSEEHSGGKPSATPGRSAAETLYPDIGNDK